MKKEKKEANGEVHVPIGSFGEIPGRHIGGKLNGMKTLAMLLTLFELFLCLAAIILLVTDKQSKVIEFPGLSDFSFKKTVKFTSSKAFIYLLVATAMGGAYAFIRVIIDFIAHRGDHAMGSRSTAWFVFLLDQTFTYVLLGAVAASTEMAYLGKHGFEEAGWMEICTYFNRFCNQMVAALAVGYLGTVCFGISAILSAFNLFTTY